MQEGDENESGISIRKAPHPEWNTYNGAQDRNCDSLVGCKQRVCDRGSRFDWPHNVVQIPTAASRELQLFSSIIVSHGFSNCIV